MTPSNLEILAYEDTPLGPLCLRRRELLSAPGTVVTEVTLDHEFLMSSHHTASERALAAVALEMHGCGREGGDGGRDTRTGGSDDAGESNDAGGSDDAGGSNDTGRSNDARESDDAGGSNDAGGSDDAGGNDAGESDEQDGRHAEGLTVLVGGLGLGYTAHAALASPRVARVVAVELLPQVIGWLERGLVPLAGDLRADGRFAVVEGDVYARLAGAPTERFDMILIDVDHAPDDRLGGGNESFYTADGLGRASRHLAPGGVLGVWSYAESSDFSRALRRVFRDVRVEPVTFVNEMVGEERTDWLFFASAASPPEPGTLLPRTVD